MKGSYYGDNSRYLYEWVLINKPHLKPVWLTSNKNVFKHLDNDSKPVLLQFSFRAVRFLTQAKVAAFTNSLKDLSFDSRLIPDSIQLIALRHGRSVKRVRFARREHKISQSEVLNRNHESNLIKYVISTSDYISDLQEKCLLIGINKHIVTGYPRNDALLNPPLGIASDWMDMIAGVKPNHVILYAPTWRHGRESTQFFPFDDFDKDLLINFLELTGTLLLFRPHVNDLKYTELNKFLNSFVDSTNMAMMASHEQWSDVNSMLPFIDALICDYSALYHDFLLLDKPIILVPYDMEDFDKQNGFLYDYKANALGPIVDSLEKLVGQINDSVVNGDDRFRDKRHKLRDKIHTFQDDQSSARVAMLIEKIVS